MAASLADAAGHSVMVGAGETYIPAFALALGMGDVAAGLISSLPMMAGASLQLASPWAVDKLKSRRRFVVACSALQALTLLLFPCAMFAGPVTTSLVFVAAGLYWAFGLATSPVWNTWIEELIPAAARTRFFAHRGRISQCCVLAGFALGGLLLQAGYGSDGFRQATATAVPLWTFTAFGCLFGASALCRFASAWSLSRQSEPSRGRFRDRRIGWREWKHRLRSDPGARLVLYLLAVQAAVQVSGPYFTPLMLSQSQLGFSYFQFMLLVSIAFVGKVLFFPTWGKVARRLGSKRLLWIGGIAIVPVPALTIATGDFYLLLAVQFYSGVAWAGYELAMLLMFFDAIPRDERTSVLTVYNFGNAVALVVGSLCGGALLHVLDAGETAYLVVFLASAFCRMASIGFLFLIPRVQTGTRASDASIGSAAALAPADASGVVRITLDGMPAESSPHSAA